MSNPFYEPVDPESPPGPVTPQAGPGDPAGFAMVAPHGQGPAPYNIQADNDEGRISAAFDAAVALTGPGGPRQQAANTLLSSPQGFSVGSGTSGYDIPQGWTGEPDESFVNNAQPHMLLETPIQGQMGTYPSSTSTVQEGLRKYGTS